MSCYNIVNSTAATSEPGTADRGVVGHGLSSHLRGPFGAYGNIPYRLKSCGAHWPPRRFERRGGAVLPSVWDTGSTPVFMCSGCCCMHPSDLSMPAGLHFSIWHTFCESVAPFDGFIFAFAKEQLRHFLRLLPPPSQKRIGTSGQNKVAEPPALGSFPSSRHSAAHQFFLSTPPPSGFATTGHLSCPASSAACSHGRQSQGVESYLHDGFIFSHRSGRWSGR